MFNPIMCCFDMQEGASEADLSILPKYKFQACQDGDSAGVGAGRMVPTETNGGYMATERILLPEDAVSALYLHSHPYKIINCLSDCLFH